MEIIHAAIENAADAGRIIYTSWLETYRGLMPDRVLDAHSLKRCTDRAEQFYKNYRLAYADGQAAGVICFTENARDFCTHCEGGEVEALYVLKKYQHQGIGRALMNTAFEAIGQKGITLFVLKGNENAIGFYKALGFEFTGKSIDDEQNGITETEMFRPLIKA